MGLEIVALVFRVPFGPVHQLLLGRTNRDIGRRVVIARENSERVLQRWLGDGFNLDLLHDKNERVLLSTVQRTNALIVEMTSLETAFTAHDVGAADFTPYVAQIVRRAGLVRLTRVFTNFAEHGLLVGDTTRHFGWFAGLAMFII